ncbi:Bromodomain adjacent to zinc finger domain protein 2B [Halotydeus destructor]|nr:Bromodomain adjacent to zinc finger domain protein 2B [Halotydeus destructor]
MPITMRMKMTCEAPSVEDSDSYNHEVGCRLDIAVLEQIESLEEKIANSSMQIRGWKTLPRLSLDTSVTFRHEVKNFPTGLQEEAQDESRNGVDDEVSENKSESGTTNPVLVGRQRLLSTEAVIERRYLKPPLGYKNNTVILVTGVDEYAENAADENAPSGLIKWREAVRICTSGAQLALLLHFLESCIAWDKSIMRASCQFCTCGENEAELLLCDGCDRGYHTYCFKPKMAIPEGDWYCYECQNKNTIDKVCIVCGKKGKLLSCDICPKVFHPNCIDPPVTKPSKGRWCCHMCNRTRPRKALPKSTSNSRKGPAPFQSPVAEEKVTKEVLDESEADVETPKSKGKPKGKSKAKKAPKAAEKTEETTSASEDKPVKAEKEKKKSSVGRKGRDKDAEDMAALETLVSEMMNNEEAWPFLKPVPTKQFPTYKKIIKRPMDLTTIKNRLENGTYKTRSDFLADVRLIFDNCETFNEDESPVGRCGHELRKFFEKRWTELFE